MKTEFQSLQSSSGLQKYLENTAPCEVISLPGIFSMQHHHPLTESENHTKNFLFITHPFLISSGPNKKTKKPNTYKQVWKVHCIFLASTGLPCTSATTLSFKQVSFWTLLQPNRTQSSKIQLLCMLCFGFFLDYISIFIFFFCSFFKLH